MTRKWDTLTKKERFVNIGNEIHLRGEWWCSANGEHCADVIATALNELLDENEQLKSDLKHELTVSKALRDVIKELEKELFESEKDYLIENYHDNPARRDDKIESLKEEFKRRFGRDFE